MFKNRLKYSSKAILYALYLYCFSSLFVWKAKENLIPFKIYTKKWCDSEFVINHNVETSPNSFQLGELAAISPAKYIKKDIEARTNKIFLFFAPLLFDRWSKIKCDLIFKCLIFGFGPLFSIEKTTLIRHEDILNIKQMAKFKGWNFSITTQLRISTSGCRQQ